MRKRNPMIAAHSRPELADPLAPPRAFTAAEVPRIDAIDASLARIERHLRDARRAPMALSLVAVALGPVHTPDGAPSSAAALARAFGQRLRGRSRASDDLWCIGEGEWIAVLPGCRPEGARQVRRRWVRMLAEPFRVEAGLLCTTPRIGLAWLSTSLDHAGALLAAAQAALDFDEPLHEPGRRAG